MLDELSRVPWWLALVAFTTGVAMAILLASIFDDDGSTTPRSPEALTLEIHSREGEAPRAGEAEHEGESPQDERIPLPRLVGQRFMVGLREADPSPKLLQDARNGEIGGVLVFAENSRPGAVAAAIGRLQQAAKEGDNWPLLIAIDQEGGPVKRFEMGPPYEPLSSLDREQAQRAGAETAAYLRGYGINVDLAPVVDLGLPGSFMTAQHRTISVDPSTVASIASGFAAGLEQVGVMPVVKHFPGLGSATSNTDEGESVVEAGVGMSLEPYRTLIDVRIPAIMISTAIYQTLDGDHGAAWSSEVVKGLLRRKLGFQGLVISDDLSTAGVAASLPISEAATEAAAAGVDVLMISEPDAFREAYDAVLMAAHEGRISRKGLESSYERILHAKERFGT